MKDDEKKENDELVSEDEGKFKEDDEKNENEIKKIKMNIQMVKDLWSSEDIPAPSAAYLQLPSYEEFIMQLEKLETEEFPSTFSSIASTFEPLEALQNVGVGMCSGITKKDHKDAMSNKSPSPIISALAVSNNRQQMLDDTFKRQFHLHLFETTSLALFHFIYWESDNLEMCLMAKQEL